MALSSATAVFALIISFKLQERTESDKKSPPPKKKKKKKKNYPSMHFHKTLYPVNLPRGHFS